MKRIYVLIGLLMSVYSLVHADRNDGVYAHLRGDYASAYNVFISLAKTSDDAIAQYYLGMMHLEGQGVEQDYKQAGEWFRKASEQRFAVAMYKLARLYATGDGVPKDAEFAYVWYSVGGAHGHEKSSASIAEAQASLSDEERAEAELLLARYLKKYGPKEDTDPTAKPQ